MAQIIPFPAIRYRQDKLDGPLAAVVAPPYDVISVADQDRLYERSSHNVIRLILNRQYDGDSPTDNRYTRAAQTFERWQQQGLLVEDFKPAFYIYEQTFSVAGSAGPRRHTRRGVLAALKLEPFGQGRVYPHEETFPSHKTDRYNLMKACRANFSAVFGLVPDTDRSIQGLLQAATAGRPLCAEVSEESGVENRMWAIDDEALCARISAAFEERKVFIADGHHRYETACTYRDERWKNDSQPGSKHLRAYDYVLMMCVPMSDPGLHILPTHRLIRSADGYSKQEFLQKIAPLFDQQPASDAELQALAESIEGPVRFGVVWSDGQKAILTAKSDQASQAMKTAAPGKSESWRSLDVAILHELLLRHGLGVGKVKDGTHKNGVGFTKDVREVLQMVPEGSEYIVGFVMRPTRIDQVCAVSEAGERMPQKSTYFYPKLLSGLVMRRL